MQGDAFMTTFASVVNVLFVVLAGYIYLALSRQIAARAEVAADETARRFGLPEVILGAVLACLFTYSALKSFAAAAQTEKTALGTPDLIANVVFSLSLL